VWTAGGGAANYGVSRFGTLVYVPAGTPAPRSLVWVDRQGKETPISAPARVYDEPRLSPDGTRVAITTLDQENDIYVWDLAREGLTRLTFGPTFEAHAVWTSDGQRIVHSSTRTGAAGVSNLFAQAADGSGGVERLTTGRNFQRPSFIAPDGTGILGFEQSPTTAGDIVWFRLGNPASRSVSDPASDSSSTQVEALIRTPFTESNPEISPDGRYLAYQSNESGPFEIYVRPFPKVNDGRWQVSTAGGTSPLWAKDGRELFYLDLANRLTAAPVQTSGARFVAGNPARVLDAAYADTSVYERAYDASPDGQRFLMMKELAGDPNANPAGRVVVLNWFEELKQRVPVP
jgi:serine/threonine-protein kinase